jgi:diguanylate cyclase (GGDEF)-like protein
MKQRDTVRFTITLAVGLVLLVGIQLLGFMAERRAERATRIAVQLVQDVERIRYYDELLTMSARLAAASGDTANIRRYHAAVPKLSAVLEDAFTVMPDAAARAALRDTSVANDALVRLEEGSFKMVAAGDRAGAYAQVTSHRYVSLKAEYALGMQIALDRLTVASNAAQTNSHRERMATLVGAVAAAGLLGFLWLRTDMGLRRSRLARIMMEDKLRHRAFHDQLTGLPNRTMLFDRLDRALQDGEGAGTTAGLLVMDLDRFKEINDTFGHSYGDALLKQIGARLCSTVRARDTVARLGGDEFAVLLPDIADLSEATALAAEIRAVLEMSFHVQGVDLDVEASVGVVLSGEHGTDAATLVRRADIAMYVAKAQNLGVFAYDPSVDGHSPARLALLGELRRALSLGQLVLHYQPKISISTSEVVGAEALVRWQHPERGLIFPDDFIPLAEHTGLIGPLTAYVLDAALTQARAWMDDGRPLMMSVNLSARNLLDEGLPQQVAELLAKHGVPARLLELEVTESAMMTEPARAQSLLEALAALGIRLSIDDFGSGYTSLGQLKNLPITELKIDRSFIMNMGEDRSDALIVRSIINLGHSLDLTIVAEGVETADALAHLLGLGCDVAQGYYQLRPVPAPAFDTWRAARPLIAPAAGQSSEEMTLPGSVATRPRTDVRQA